MVLEDILWVLTVSVVAVCVILGWAVAIAFVRLMFSVQGSAGGGSISRLEAFSQPRSNYRPPPSLLRPGKPRPMDAQSSSPEGLEQINWNNSNGSSGGGRGQQLPVWPEGAMWRQLEGKLRSRLAAIDDAAVDGHGKLAEPSAIMLNYSYLYDMA